MDFDLHGSDKPPKRGSPDSFGYDDHSPNSDDLLKQPHHKMNTSDDFEHIHSDKLLDTDYDLLNNSSVNAPPPTKQPLQQQNLIDDFPFSSSAHHKAATMDFMQAERGGLPEVQKTEVFSSPFNSAPSPPTNPRKNSGSLYDMEDNYMNPYASSNKSESVISSNKDVLKDIEEPELRTKTPDLFHDDIAPAVHKIEMQKIPDFSDEPVKPEKISPPAPVPAPRDESPIPHFVPEPIKSVKEPEPLKPEPLKPQPIIQETVKPVELPPQQKQHIERPKVEPPKKPEPKVEPPKIAEPKIEPAKKPEAAVRKTKQELTSAEEMFCRYGLGKLKF